MNIMRSLFCDDFDQVIESTQEQEIFNGIVFFKIFKKMNELNLFELGQNFRYSIDFALDMKSTIDTPNCIRDNWAVIQRIIKSVGFNLDVIINNVLQHGRSVDIHIFIYEFFNIYRIIKDQTYHFSANMKLGRSQLRIHNDINSVDQCERMFEKIVFLFAKACKIRPLEVI